MKEIEFEITVTSIIMFLVGVIIYGFYNALSKNTNFLTFEIIADGCMITLIYIFFVWMNSRRHKKLIKLALVYIAIILIFIVSKRTEEVNSLSNEGFINWKDIALLIYYVIAFEISRFQGKKLLHDYKKD